MKYTFFPFLFLFLCHFNLEAQTSAEHTIIEPLSEGSSLSQITNTNERKLADKSQKKNKSVKKINLFFDNLQKRLELEQATTISNANLPNFQKAEVILGAKEYIGTPYHYGGMSKKGIDCSALMLFAYTKSDLELPRTSRAQSKIGTKINKSNAEPGDLIFFKTNRRKSFINHVGLITENHDGFIKFIHASSSKGVIESSLKESYYQRTFAKIKRIIE